MLHRLEVRAGDRVAILAQNSDRYVEVLLGIWWAGAVAVPVNTRWSVAEMAYSFTDCGCGQSSAARSCRTGSSGVITANRTASTPESRAISRTRENPEESARTIPDASHPPVRFPRPGSAAP